MKRGKFDIVPLGELLEGKPRNGYSPVCPELPTGKWVLSLSALDGRGLDLSEPKPAPANDPLVDKFMLRPGDFLISRSNTFDKVGRVGVFRGELDNCSYPDLMMRFRPNREKVNPLYLETYLKSDAAIKFIRQHATGTSGSMKKINQSTVESIPVVVPSISEQALIATVLLEWYEAIQKAEQLIAAKERHYSHELSRLISRGQHPHAHVGTFAEEVSARNRSGTPAVLGDFLVESRDPDTDQEAAKRLTVRLHLQGIEARPVRGTESDGATVYFRRRAGQLIYGKQNIFRGAIGLIPSELDGHCSTQDLPAFDIGAGVDPEWLYYWLSRKGFYESLEALAAGSGSKRLHPEEFFKIRITLPDIATQTAIARYLNALREEIDLLGHSVAALMTQKRGLMQKLLTGQWRLPLQEEAATA